MTMPSSKTSHRIVLFLLSIFLLATWVWWANRAKPVEVAVAAVEKGTVEKTVANTRAGTVKACRRAKLSPSAGGQIASLPVSEGEAVKRGQLLLELWNKDLTAQLDLTRQEATSAAATARALHRGRSGPARGRPPAETPRAQTGLGRAARSCGLVR